MVAFDGTLGGGGGFVSGAGGKSASATAIADDGSAGSRRAHLDTNPLTPPRVLR